MHICFLFGPPLQALKTKGPLSITIWADRNPSFLLYSSGIFVNTYTTERECLTTERGKGT